MIQRALLTITCLRAVSAPLAEGQPRSICPNKAIKGVQGRNVILEYHLVPQENKSATFEVERVDLDDGSNVVDVFFYRHEQDNPDAQMDQYRGRVTLIQLDLRRGILILQISSVNMSDSGRYGLFFPQLKGGCHIDLTVDQQNEAKRTDSTGPPVEVTKPDDQDPAEKEPLINVPGVVVAAVVAVAAAAAAAAAIFVLVKHGKIQICMMWQEARSRREAERKSDNLERENLRTQTTEGEEDPHRAAENGPPSAAAPQT